MALPGVAFSKTPFILSLSLSGDQESREEVELTLSLVIKNQDLRLN